MPMVDMPLKDLRQYKGLDPKPADFDAYWDEGIAEMEALGTDYTLEPAEFQAPGVRCDYLFFTGVGGARVCCKFLRPEKIEGKLRGLCMFHGYSGSSGDWFSKLPWAYAGFAVLALDVRGQMGLSMDNQIVAGNTFKGHIIRGLETNDPKQLFFRNVFLDTAQTARILMAMPFVDETKVAATGGSQGGGLTLACAGLTPTLNRCSPGVPFLTDYRRVWEMDLDQGAYEELRYYFRSKDPAHENEDRIFEMLSYIDVKNLATRIKAKTLLYTGLMDTICPPSTQFAAYNAISAPKEHKIYPDFGHESMPGQLEHQMEYFLEM